MRIHKEGSSIILITLAALLLPVVLVALLSPLLWITLIVAGVALLFWLFVISFFRSPHRVHQPDPTAVFSPADGTVVVVEEVLENEYFKDKRIQVSVFMSIWNVHVNWYPVSGVVDYFKHHHGRFMVAWHPKSSEENERTTTVVDTGKCKILFRQIAGLVARRIVSYAEVGGPADSSKNCGFIKFGSRVDVFLPVDAKVEVKIGQKVIGSKTVLAELNDK